MNTNTNTETVKSLLPLTVEQKPKCKVGRPPTSLTKTIQLINGKRLGRGRPPVNATVTTVEIPYNEKYDAAKHGVGVGV